MESFRAFAQQKCHLTNHYDLRIIYGSVDQSSNILIRLIESFADALNANVKLPHMVFIFLDADFEKITGDHDTTEKMVKLLISKLVSLVVLYIRYGKLPFFKTSLVLVCMQNCLFIFKINWQIL